MSAAAWDLRWQIGREREREQRLHAAIRVVEENERRLEEELARVDQQVAYYDALARDMKSEFRRPGLSAVLRSLRR